MKDIKGYEGLYAVTTCGKVWSYRSKKFLSPGINSGGYYQVLLHVNTIKRTCSVHRLVAEAYLPVVEGKDNVDHIDGVKTHSYIGNLEWVTPEENCKRAWDLGLKEKIRPACANNGRKCSKTILQVDKDTDELLSIWTSTMEIERTLGFSHSTISACCKGKHKQMSGYKWYYTSYPVNI